MADEHGSQKFLDIENAAANLVSSLEAIKDEAAHYSLASSSLDAARAAIAPAAEKYAALAGEFEVLAKSLREIGMPALIESQAALQSTVEAQLEDVNQSLEKSRDASSTIVKEVDSLKRALDETRIQVVAAVGESTSAAEQVVEGNTALSRKIATEAKSTTDSVSKLRGLVIAGVASTFILGILNFIVILAK
jgi:DNA repair exonuclease SbcCD ATPase subunit